MADRTPIEWTDATWNTIGGCTRVDEGCRNCYAEVMAARFNGPGQWGEGLARIVTSGGKADHRWTGKVIFRESALTQPLRWGKPRLIFVNSTADTFHESVPDEWIDRIFAVMALCSQHTFQVLTKRPDRAMAYLTKLSDEPSEWRCKRLDYASIPVWPLPNVWLGTSISDQASADLRIPDLLATPAAVRFVSAEPLLGPVDLLHLRRYNPRGEPWINALRGLVTRGQYLAKSPEECSFNTSTQVIPPELPSLDWVIVGGESGPGARVWDGFEAACRSLRDQCHSAGVAFFMKQMAGARKSAMPPIPDDLMVRQMPGVRA